MLVFNKYFYKNKKSKLYVGDRVAVLNDFIYQTGGSTVYIIAAACRQASNILPINYYQDVQVGRPLLTFALCSGQCRWRWGKAAF
jgi:hypothetical protein